MFNEQNAKIAAQNICESKNLKMPEQDFVNRRAATVGSVALHGAGLDQPAQPTEMEAQISELEVSVAALEQHLACVVKKLEPLIRNVPEKNGGDTARPRPARGSYYGHRLQEIQARIDFLAAGVVELHERLAV